MKIKKSNIQDVSKPLNLVLLIGAILVVFFSISIGLLINYVDEKRVEESLLEQKILNIINCNTALSYHILGQVREWKNILIRGRNKEAYDKYYGLFNKEQDLAKEEFKKIDLAFENLDFKDYIPKEELNSILHDFKQLKEEHAELSVTYNELLLENDITKPNAAFEIDYKIRGIDRRIFTLNEDLEKRFNKLYKEIKEINDVRSQSRVVNLILTETLVGLLLIISIVTIFKKYRKPFDKNISDIFSDTNLLSNVIDSLPNPVFILDQNGMVKAWNKACEIATGKEGEEIIGTKDHSFAWYGHEKLTLADASLYGAIANEYLSKLDDFSEENRVKKEDNSIDNWIKKLRLDANNLNKTYTSRGNYIFYCEVELKGKFYHCISQPLWNEAGVCVGSVEIFHDQTLEKEIQEKLLSANKLEKEAAFAKTNFLATISHEMRTPLNAIISYSNMLGKDKELKNDTKVKAAKTYQASQMLLAIVNDLLDYAKFVENNNLILNNESSNLETICINSFSCVMPRISEKEIFPIIKIDKNVPKYIDVDGSRLSQVLVNLLSNSAKFTIVGEISLNVTKRKNKIVFSVKDSGIGMEKEVVEKIFSPFIQGDSSISKKFGGTGLGLSISQKIVEAFGSKIKVESKPMEGSLFTFDVEMLNPIYETEEKINKIILHTSVNYLSYLKDVFIDGIVELIDYVPDFYIDKNIYIFDNKYKKEIPYNKNIWFIDLSKKDKNTEQILSLPITRNQLEDLNQLSKKDNFSLGGEILVVDDMDFNREIVRDLCVSIGLNVDLAVDGAEAFDKFKKNPTKYKVILMDIQMPIMSGVVSAKEINSFAEKNNIDYPKIIALSANVDLLSEKEIEETRMTDFFQKPFNPEKLINLLKNYYEISYEEDTILENKNKDEMLLPNILDRETIKKYLSGNKKLINLGIERCNELCKETQEEVTKGTVHKLKSTAGMIGANKLSKLSEQMQQLIDKNNVDPIVLDEFKKEVKIYIDSYKEYKSVIEKEHESEIDSDNEEINDEQYELLKYLHVKLSERDSIVLKTIEDDLIKNKKWFKDIKFKIENFEFKDAEQEVEQLMKGRI